MAETIKQEASTFSKMASDLDNFRSKYLEYDFEENLAVVFPSGEIYSFENQKFRLLLASKLVDFKPLWTMRPDYVSYEYYGSVIHWPVILFINNVNNIEDFKDFDKILVPTYSSVLDVISNRLTVEDVQPLDVYVVDESIKYLKRQPLDYNEIGYITSRTNTNKFNEKYKATDVQPVVTQTILSENVELFTIDSSSTTQVTLEYNPVNITSISLFIDEYVLPQRYGYDYVLKNNNIVSWASTDVMGTGIYDIIKEGTVVKILYLYEYTSGV